MKQEILHDIQVAAKNDFKNIKEAINSSQKTVTASTDVVRLVAKDNVVTATCNFIFDDNEVVTASIDYKSETDGIYADSSINDVAEAVLGAIAGTPITAADASDAFDFDAEFEDQTEDAVDAEDVVDVEDPVETVSEEVPEDFEEDPESDPDIETDNNIAGHYIAECNRCHGIFISALVESDQQVEFISGICPLCEKESDQYIKWVVKPI